MLLLIIISRQRVADKFLENDMEKVERLLEMHEKYLTRLRAADATIANVRYQ